MSSFQQHIHIEIHGNAYQYFGSRPDEPVAEAAHFYVQDELGEIVRQKPEITFNTNRTTKSGKKAPDGIEIRFGTARPTEAVRELLKQHGFQFSEKQVLWYAYDNEQSRALAERWMNEEVEVDNTQYVKQHFWARVRSQEEYNQLREYTEFFLKTEPPKNYNGKRQLENSPYRLADMLRQGLLYFKKFYNKAVDEDDEPGDPTSYDSAAVADKLEQLAAAMEKEIESKLNSATSKQRPTAKRLRVAAGQRKEGEALLEIQRILYALANAHRTGNIDKFPYLQYIRTKTQVYLLNKYATAVQYNWNPSDTFNNNQEDLQRLHIESWEQWGEAAEQKKQLLADYSPSITQDIARQNQSKIKDLEAQAFNEQIPGFFPTPPDLVNRMLELADLDLRHTILDPSAGKGDILDAVAARFTGKNPALYATEVNSTLRDILHLKGYTLWGRDFLELTPDSSTFDRILMNPPFENGQDTDHVTHALKLLRPGGRLVAIVSEGPFFREFKKDKAFRELLQEKNAYISEPIKEGFKNAFNATGVNVRMIAINQDGSPVTHSNAFVPPEEVSNNPAPVTTSPGTEEEIELLELEAEAELELLKMRVELERKRKGRALQGIAGINLTKLQQLRQKAWALQNDAAVLDFK